MKRNRNERASGEMGPAGVCIQTCYFSGDGGGGDAGDGGYRGPFWAQGSCLEGREERAESEQRAERASPGGTAGAAPGAGSRGRRRPRVGRRSRGIPEGGRDGETDGGTDRRTGPPLGTLPIQGFPLTATHGVPSSAGGAPALCPDPKPALPCEPAASCITSKFSGRKACPEEQQSVGHKFYGLC